MSKTKVSPQFPGVLASVITPLGARAHGRNDQLSVNLPTTFFHHSALHYLSRTFACRLARFSFDNQQLELTCDSAIAWKGSPEIHFHTHHVRH